MKIAESEDSLNRIEYYENIDLFKKNQFEVHKFDSLFI